MIQHTMQEWSDWTGCITSVDRSKDCLHFFTGNPRKVNHWWDVHSGDYHGNISLDLVSDAATHDWTVLVEPHTDYTCPHCGNPLNVTVKNGTCEPICEKCGKKMQEEEHAGK